MGVILIPVIPIYIGLVVGCMLLGGLIGYGLGAGLQNIIVRGIEKKVSADIENTKNKVALFFEAKDGETPRDECKRRAELPYFG